MYKYILLKFLHNNNDNIDINDLKNKNNPHLFIENGFWLMQNGTVDKNLIFKDRETGEYFMFDQNGFWDAENINHKLLVWSAYFLYKTCMLLYYW